MNSQLNPQTIAAALQAGRAHDAETLCRMQLAAQPQDESLLLLLAMSLHLQGKVDQAAPVYRRLTELVPASSVNWANYANALRELGDLGLARQAYLTALEHAPNDIELLISLGLLQMQERDFVAARGTLIKAHAIDPTSARARIYAARACSESRDYRADDLLLPWREWLPLEEDLQYELATLQLTLGHAYNALELLEDLVRRAPSNIQAALQRANVYERLNRPDDAQAALQPLLAAWIGLEEPARVEIRHQQATLALRKGDAALARTLLEQAGPRHDYDYDHYFSLAKICDKLGDAQAAMLALKGAHERQIDELKRAVPFRFEPGAPILPAGVHLVTAADYLGWPQLTAPDGAQSPIFIVGYPRSGTTLLEQMLDAHPRLQSMDERPFFNTLADQLEDVGLQIPQDLHRLNQRDCDELRKAYLSMACSKVPRRWDAQLVDKNPLNMLWLPMIHRLFPRAKFILALRHPCDVILSNYMQNFRSGVLATASADLETLAKAYVTAMNYWLHHVEVFQPDLLVSRYEDLVDDPAARTARIAQFLGLDDAAHLLTFDQRARDKGFIATPSYTQVIEPVNRKGLDRWQRYRDYFEPALPILQPILQHWGYSTDAKARAAPASSPAI